MHDLVGEDCRSVRSISRRAWLTGVVAGMAAGNLLAEEDAEPAEVRAAIAHAKKLGLEALHARHSKRFTAVGNAPDDYLRITLTDCEAVARDFMDHFTAKGFSIALPRQRMTVVVLQDARAFARFLNLVGNPSDRTKVYPLGLYHRKANALIVQDFRQTPRGLQAIPRWAMNLEVLAHEATHQLTFNVGMLEREGDVPACIAEGLGIYGELRKPDARSPLGTINRGRLATLAHYQRVRGWTPFERLLTDEGWRTTHDAVHTPLFYAQSWLLVHFLLSDAERTDQLQSYFDRIRPRRDRDHRVDDARAAFGDLAKLDAALKQHSIRLMRQI